MVSPQFAAPMLAALMPDGMLGLFSVCASPCAPVVLMGSRPSMPALQPAHASTLFDLPALVARSGLRQRDQVRGQRRGALLPLAHGQD